MSNDCLSFRNNQAFKFNLIVNITIFIIMIWSLNKILKNKFINLNNLFINIKLFSSKNPKQNTAKRINVVAFVFNIFF